MLEEKISPMQAYSSKPFDSEKHIFEIKWDGTRCILFLKGKEVRLQNRRLVNITSRYPEVSAGAPAEIKARNAILDGELVVLFRGKPNFQRLQQREHILNPLRIKLLSKRMPASYMAFDLLFLNGKELTQLPLMERKENLKNILRASDFIIESEYVKEKGKIFYERVIERGFEGAMAKSVGSPYLIGQRSWHWLKIKPRSSAVCYIIGYMKGAGGRTSSFGSLVLASLEEGEWIFRGNVGSGFNELDLKEISSRLQGLKIDSPPVPVPKETRVDQWVKPQLKCEVLFQEITENGLFRVPVFKRLLE